ncbi:MAG: ISL3 family transposase [Planctomycetes bacterium]|nr:ISL3 family transposase [Planctomycetota bacterium]
MYEQILGIGPPWFVERVELDVEEGVVNVSLAHRDDAKWTCPECGRECPLHDHAPQRTWRHLDTCQYQTLLGATTPRTRCPEHGVRAVRLPWAEPHSRFTLLFERLAIDWLSAASQQAVAERLNLSWDEVHGIMDRAVKRGLKRREARPLPRIGVDEKAFRKRHRYATLVTDLDRGCVLFVAQDRKQSSLDGFWKTLTDEQLSSIEAVAMDMWDPYENSIRQHLPEAENKIVYDKFHVAKHLGEAVDRVRRAENKALRQAGDERLVGTKYQWLRHPSNFDDDQWRRFAALRNSNLKTARAWALKEQAMSLWDYTYEASARKQFAWWYRWATHSRLKPMIEKAKMLKARLPNILTYLKHGVTNAVSESLNAKIQWVKYTARGFRNFQNFVNAIYFHCGNLNLSPAPT